MGLDSQGAMDRVWSEQWSVTKNVGDDDNGGDANTVI